MADDSVLTITETLEIPLAELHFQVKNHRDNLDMSGSAPSPRLRQRYYLAPSKAHLGAYSTPRQPSINGPSPSVCPQVER